MLRITNQLPAKLRIAWFRLDGVTVRPQSAALRRAVESRSRELRDRFADPAAAGPALQPARALYRGFGIDPSKHRPSSEALLRRILQGKGLYEVNTAVDAANLACLAYHLPVGLYDVDAVAPGDEGICLRVGAPGEEYRGIGKPPVHLEGRPTLADARGAFGNPSADSYRTRVTERTRSLLFVVFGPPTESVGRMSEHRERSVELLREHNGGEATERGEG